MATSSILGGEHVPAQPSGRDVDALGPSDNSDSGSDAQTGLTGSFEGAESSTSDSQGTGERATVDTMDPVDGADILPDRIGTMPPGQDSAASERMDDPAAASTEELALSEDEEAADDEDADPEDD